MGRSASAQPVLDKLAVEVPEGKEINDRLKPTSRQQLEKRIKPLDVVLVLDNSGSMKQNDPQGLMHRVVSDFADHLSRAAQLGIVVFDEKAKFVLELTPVNASDFDSRVDLALAELTYSGKRTDISIAVERALYALRDSKRANAERILVLLTDGIIDVGEPAFNREQSKWLRENLALEAKRHGIRIFGVAFTEAADYQLIQSLSLTTDGTYFRVLQAEQIPGLFDKILQGIVDLTNESPKESAEPPPVQQKRSSETPESKPIVVEINPKYYEAWVGIGGVLLLIAIILIVMLVRSRKEKVPFAQMIRIDELADKEPYIINDRITRIGRDEDANDLVILEDTVSAQHAILEYRNNMFYIRDLKSGNGTSLNGYPFSSKLEERELPLKDTDRISFDVYEYQFQLSKKVDDRINTPSKRPEVGRTVLREPLYYPIDEIPPNPLPKSEYFSTPDQNVDAEVDTEVVAEKDPDQEETGSFPEESASLSNTWRSLPPPPVEATSPDRDTEQNRSDPAPPKQYRSKTITKSDRSKPGNSTERGIAPPHPSSNRPRPV